jgi:two-component system sensor histidine kinase/response regulator
MENHNRILVIDDEEVVLDSCVQDLEGRDYQMATAMDGAKGLKMVREFQPDLVFVDLKMPGISGFEVLEQIRAIDPTIVPIVITGYATVSSAVEAMKKGAFDFLPKPFTPDELRMITRRGMEKRGLVLETIALRREKEMLRENFAAIVAHELKSPLSAVQQNLFTLSADLSDKLDEDGKKRLARMTVRVDDLLKLIQMWLRAISVDFAKIKENFVIVSMKSCISKALESVQPQATRKGIEIIPTVDEKLKFVYGYEGSLVEALVNVIGNAVKYSRPDSKVFVAAETKEDDVLISVKDTGVGISKEDMPFVFDDFYRGKSGKAVEQGSGLGLAISRRIIEAHNGTISVESELGKGSTFVIRLPALKKRAGATTGIFADALNGGVK